MRWFAPAGPRLSGLVRAADRAQRILDRAAAWQDRAAEQANGKGSRARIHLLAARPILSARDAATALSVTPFKRATF